MQETKTYPEFSTFQTTTVLPCAKCATEITMYTPVITDGQRYWHAETCSPQQVEPAEVHTVESPEESKGE